MSTLLHPTSQSGRQKPPSNLYGVVELREPMTRQLRPFFTAPRPQCGFPSPAADYQVSEDALDLNDLMVRNPPATFFVRASGDSMDDAGIRDGDILVVDRSIDPEPGRIVVAAVDGAFYVKRLRRVRGRLALCSENRARAADYRPIYLDEAQDHTIWGVVTGSVRKLL